MVNSGPQSRREYMRNEGFVLADEVGHQFMEDAPYLVDPVIIFRSEDYWLKTADSPSGGALGMVTVGLCRQLDKHSAAYNNEFYTHYGVTREDLGPDNRFTFSNGFADQSFTWHFAAGLANGVAEMFEEKGYISAEQRADLTLGDWATAISSKWFSDLVHDMALAKNGVHQSFGYNLYNYAKNGLKDFFAVSGRGTQGELLKVKSVYDITEDRTFLGAETTSQLRSKLRAGMKETESPGCPVARRAGTLPAELVSQNPHARRLVAAGHLAVINSTSERVRFIQDETPIDSALSTLASLLYEYDLRYGTPTWETQKRYEIHTYRPMTHVLTHEGQEPFVPLQQT